MKGIGRLMRVHGHLGKNLIMKIDIEGYEYPAHDAMTDEEISCFTQITCAVHDLQDLLTNFGRHLSVSRFLQKIFNQMHCAHVHANNVGWQAEAHGLKDPLFLGLTFVRKNKGTTFVTTNDLRDNKDTEFNRRKK